MYILVLDKNLSTKTGNAKKKKSIENQHILIIKYFDYQFIYLTKLVLKHLF